MIMETCLLFGCHVDMVGGILLSLLQASREGNWILHLHAVRLMIPWCFSYDKVNYAEIHASVL